MTYLFLQCSNESCRFRFPASVGEAKAVRCPRCHSEVSIAAAARHDKPSPLTSPPSEIVFIGLLDNIRSIHNVGSMFRSADGAGVFHLHLTGITATPEHPKLSKAALGANEIIPWTYHRNGVDAAIMLRDCGYHLWALERLNSPTPPLISPDSPLPEKLALIVGNERAGVDPGIMALCHGVISLPMMGEKSSLNVAVAFGIAIYSLRFGKRLSTG